MKLFIANFGLEIILFVIIAFLIGAGLKFKTHLLKHLCFNLSAVFIAIFIIELSATLVKRPESEITYSKPFLGYNPNVGYGIKHGDYSTIATKQWLKTKEDIYQAQYSFYNGQRVTPNSNKQSHDFALFLGGSFAFGEGVNDNQTLPYYYNDALDKKRHARNYGVSGYGTHQVYTLAKNNIIKDPSIAKAENVDVFYWFIDAHILRANGVSEWDKSGPHYELNNGVLTHLGQFKDTRSQRSFIKKLTELIWLNSAIYNSPHWRLRLLQNKKNMDLFLTLVKETDRLMKAKGFNFVVLMQSGSSFNSPLFDKKAYSEKVKQYFKAHNIQFIDINAFLLQQAKDIETLRIKGDGHPNALFHKILATYLAAHTATKNSN